MLARHDSEPRIAMMFCSDVLANVLRSRNSNMHTQCTCSRQHTISWKRRAKFEKVESIMHAEKAWILSHLSLKACIQKRKRVFLLKKWIYVIIRHHMWCLQAELFFFEKCRCTWMPAHSILVWYCDAQKLHISWQLLCTKRWIRTHTKRWIRTFVVFLPSVCRIWMGGLTSWQFAFGSE